MVARPARILVLDDAPDFRAFMETLLQYQGYRPRTVHSVAEARIALAEGRPELIIADLYVPDMAPRELLTWLAEEIRVRGVPVLLCTAAVLEVDAHRPAIEAAGIDVLLKPFEIDDMLDRIARLLERGARDPGGWGAK